MRGMFITFEGPDKAGKSTQIRLLCEYYEQNGIPFLLTREPGGCAISEKIRQLLLDPCNDMGPICEAMLYAAARSELVEKVIMPALQQGTTVICDRFVDSSIAYQGYGRELGAKKVAALNRWATQGLTPDITFYLSIRPEIAQQRMNHMKKDRLERADQAFRTRVTQGYEALLQAQPERFTVVDANGSIEQIHQTILQILRERMCE